MSVGAIGAMGALDTRSVMGMEFFGQTGPFMPRNTLMPFGTADVGSPNAVQAPSMVPSTKVDISDAARSAFAGGGPGTNMGDLAQALIIALMLQLLQPN